MSGQEHTAKCRKRLEDVVTTDASTSTRVKATRVRQAGRILQTILGWRVPAVRVALVNTSAFDSQTRSARTRYLNMTQKCGLAVRRHLRRAKELLKLMQNVSARHLALRRKAEGEPDDSGNHEVEDSVMNSLARSWHRENDPDDEVDLLILQQRDDYVASVHETGGDKTDV